MLILLQIRIFYKDNLSFSPIFFNSNKLKGFSLKKPNFIYAIWIKRPKKRSYLHSFQAFDSVCR
jgi:hypothetical protein